VNDSKPRQRHLHAQAAVLNRWRQLEENDVLMEERRNDGQWVRNWRQALSDFRKFEL
jgi:hypothetical protein